MNNIMTISDGVRDVAKLDFDLIKSIEAQIAVSRDKALDFVKDPNAFMRAQLTGTYVPEKLHFHVRLGESNFPSDTTIPENQIVVSTTITLSNDIRDEVIQEIKKRQPSSTGQKFAYCDGCEECKIAIIR